MVIYSHSRLSTFEKCPLKFKFQYLDKIKPEFEETIEGFLGHKVHNTLEWLYKQISQKIIPQLDHVIQHYIADWNKDFNKEIKIIKQELNPEHYFNQGVKFLVNYFQTNHPFKDNTIATEKRIFVNLDEEGKYKLQGHIDRIVHNKDSNIFEIHDYKTGGFLKSQEELDQDRQLALYSIGIKDLFKNTKDIHLIWHFLAFNQKRISKRTNEQLEKLKQEIIQLIDKIESTKDFSPNPSKLCKWCEFRTHCPLFNGHNNTSNNNKFNNLPDKTIQTNNPTDPNLWNLYEDEKELSPLVFSNGKSQADIIREVLEAVKQGYKIIFIKGMCGTGKSAIALNLARILGKASIVVPVKSLQEQYSKDYTGKKYLLKNNEKLKIASIVGRQNFKCRFLEESKQGISLQEYYKETNAKLSDVFLGIQKPKISEKNKSCDNKLLPCKIELKEKNLPTIKDYIQQNPNVKISDFDSISEVKRMTIAPICPYWSPIISSDFEIKKFSDVRKIKYAGLENNEFIIYQRRPGCGFYDQYKSYIDADVIIFNAMKYKLETIMYRKPATEIEIIDECDNFLDSFANKEQINLNRLLFAASSIFPEDSSSQKTLDEIIDIANTLKRKYEKPFEDVFKIKDTLIEDLLNKVLENTEFLDKIETNEANYFYQLDKVARMFSDFLDETFFSVEKKDSDIIIHLVTTNLAKKFTELAEKNKILVMMSGTIHSESVLRNIYGLNKFKIIEAETQHQGELIKCKHGYEKNCSYANFNADKINREEYLKILSKTISCAKLPVLVHVNAFADLPTDGEKSKFDLDNLITQNELVQQQINDPFGKRINDFKNKKIPIFFTTKCNRGVDFPGDICNSIVITKFPYPNISAIFWKILRKTKPQHAMSFYMDKARRDLLQKIYRGLRSKDDKVFLLSPDSRVLDFNIN